MEESKQLSKFDEAMKQLSNTTDVKDLNDQLKKLRLLNMSSALIGGSNQPDLIKNAVVIELILNVLRKHFAKEKIKNPRQLVNVSVPNTPLSNPDILLKFGVDTNTLSIIKNALASGAKVSKDTITSQNALVNLLNTYRPDDKVIVELFELYKPTDKELRKIYDEIKEKEKKTLTYVYWRNIFLSHFFILIYIYFLYQTFDIRDIFQPE
jgi:hypothetical protein